MLKSSSSNISDKLKAIIGLKEVAENADRDFGTKLAAISTYIANGGTGGVTPTMAIGWFADASLFDSLNNFENKEMAQASMALLAFLKKYVPSINLIEALKLNSEELAVMHESTRENLFSGLLELMPSMTVKEVDAIIAILKGIPPEDHNNSTISFVCSVANFCATKQDSLRTLGDILWELFHIEDSGKVSGYVQTMAFNSFSKLLGKPFFARIRGVYFTQCISDIDNNISACKSTIVMERILRLNPDLLNIEQGRKTVIKVLNIIIASFATYYVCTAQKIAELKQGDTCTILSEETIAAMCFEEGIPHKKQVAVRLGFLSFVMKRYNLLFAKNYITQLWNMFHDTYVCDADRDTFYTWINTNIIPLEAITAVAEKKPRKNGMTDSDICKIFQECVTKNNDAAEGFVSPVLLDVITRFFLVTNLYNGSVIYEPDKEDKEPKKEKSSDTAKSLSKKDVTRKMYASTIALAGFDKLIFAITRARNSDIFVGSVNFLNSLFRKVVKIHIYTCILTRVYAKHTLYFKRALGSR